MKQSGIPLLKRGYNFDTLMWLFTRLSALLMYLFALIAIIGALIMGARTEMNLADVLRWSFTPNYTHIQNTNVADVAPWATTFWKLTASALVFFAAAHGIHGVLNIIEDYLKQPWLRKALRVVFLLLWVAITVIGIYVLWTY